MVWIWWVKFPAGISYLFLKKVKRPLFSVLLFFSLVLRAPCNQSCYTLVSLIFVHLLFFLVFDFNDVFFSQFSPY